MRAVPRWLASSGLGVLIAVAACDTEKLLDPAAPPASNAPAQNKVASIVVAPDSADMAVGDIVRFRATAYDQFGREVEGVNLQWRASQLSRLRVTTDGLVEGVSTGDDTLTASVDGTVGRAVLKVRTAKVSQVTVTLNPSSLTVGQSGRAYADLRQANGREATGNVYWTSSNRSVATIDDAGIITALAPGRAVITAISEGKSDSETLEVVSPQVGQTIASVSVTSPVSVLYIGRSVSFTAVARNQSGQPVQGATFTWQSSDPSIASVDGTGNVQGISSGAVTITSTSNGYSGQTTVTVAAAPVASMTVSLTPGSIDVNQNSAAGVTLYDDQGTVLSGRNVVYSSSDGDVATVSATGIVTGRQAGSATITAFSEGKSAAANITVAAAAAPPPPPAPVAQVSISAAQTTILVGQSTNLTAMLQDANGNVLTDRSVAWSANSSNVVVSSTGVVTGAAAGSATVTATSEGKSAQVTITVNSNVVLTGITMTPANVSLLTAGVQQFSVVGNYSNGTTGPVSVSYQASGGTVSLGGLYVAGALAGSFSVIARHAATGFADTSTVTISLPIAPPPPSGTGACGNEPTGFRKQVDIGFDVLPGLNAMSSEGSITWSTSDLQHLKLVSDGTAPRGGNVLQIEFPQGMPGGGAPARLLVARPNGTAAGANFEANSGDIYTCFYIKRSAGWSDNGNAGTKVLFQRPDNAGGINHYLSYDAAQNPAACFPSPVAYDCKRSSSGSAPDGVWHKIESLWIAGNAGSANGSARLWVDGRLVIDGTNIMMFPAGVSPHQDYVMFWPTYGGGTNPVPQTQYMWIDHLYVSVR